MEKENPHRHCLRSWSVQFYKQVNSLLCLSQMELVLCYWHQEKVLTLKLKSEKEFFKSNRP